MIRWLKRIGFIAVVIVILELLAWVTLAVLGEDALAKLKEVYLPSPPPEVVIKNINPDGTYKKCTTMDGELFCINEKTDEQKPPNLSRTRDRDSDIDGTPKVDPKKTSERCSTFEGEPVCINEVDTPKIRTDNVEEKCSTFEGELICIKESK